MAYNVRLELFEGPLDLLLHLIDQSELDIYDISITEITQQYLEYLQSMQKLELGIASEFILMAATLLSIKSRKLLPKPIQLVEHDLDYEEIDPQEELMLRLIEYKRYKKVTEALKEKEDHRSLYFAKTPSIIGQSVDDELEDMAEGISIYDLVSAYITGMHKWNKVDPIATIQKDQISVVEKLEYIRSQLLERDVVSFSTLITTNSVSEVVSTLLAVLELMKAKEVTCIQDKLFEDFIIMPILDHKREEWEIVDG